MLKKVVPYKETPKASEDAKWDGPAEMKACGDDIDALKFICTWYDSENPDVKASYKLPHHKGGTGMSGHDLVWNGVKAAMGALLGARGGVDIPDDDRKGVYNHLAKHYADFEKEAPEFKEYSEAEFKALEDNDFCKLEEKKDENILEEYTADFGEDHKEHDQSKIKRLTFKSVVKDLGNGMMEAIISSEALDRHGEKVDLKGLNIKEYMKNPIIADAHNWEGTSIGRAHKLTKLADGTLKAVFEFAKDISEKAKLYYNLYKEKFQYAFSIGFIPEEMDKNVYTKATLLEFSPVLIPANPEALLLAHKKGIDKTFLVIDNETMNIDEVLKKLKESGASSLTVAELNFLKEHEEDLTGKQVKEINDTLKTLKGEEEEEEEKEEGKEEGTEEVKDLKNEIKSLKKAVEKITDPANLKNISLNGKVKEEITKEKKFLYYVRGLQSGNFAEYLDIVGKGAMATSDTGIPIAPAEFIAEIERLEDEYGVVRQFATIRTVANKNGVTYTKGNDDLAIYETNEAAAKTSTKLSYTQYTLLLRKFAGILPLTDELTEDMAVDLWNDASKRFARAFTQKEDDLAFNETSASSPKNKGILQVSGTNVITLTGDSFEDLTYDDLSKAVWGVPTGSSQNGRFFLHREILGVVQRIKDLDGRPVWQRAMADGTPATIFGKPYTLAEVLPELSEDDADTPFIAFGDLKYVTLGERSGLKIVIRDTGTVTDPDDAETDLNLFTQDIQAMRAVKRFNTVVRFPAAFSVIKTGAGS